MTGHLRRSYVGLISGLISASHEESLGEFTRIFLEAGAGKKSAHRDLFFSIGAAKKTVPGELFFLKGVAKNEMTGTKF